MKGDLDSTCRYGNPGPIRQWPIRCAISALTADCGTWYSTEWTGPLGEDLDTTGNELVEEPAQPLHCSLFEAGGPNA
ncbi:hypothetical protein NHX12_030282 [Muraenolepis orangiensis]|uniref:Uncharacterized protein n=1 Tax=Muraenolepis orangiensis TaxID=630683 RepID=A0A9Q0IKV8_9TELE|nr:hypothetical protein NHX12_030282 [Muraenolepis orangiensis]